MRKWLFTLCIAVFASLSGCVDSGELDPDADSGEMDPQSLIRQMKDSMEHMSPEYRQRMLDADMGPEKSAKKMEELIKQSDRRKKSDR